MESRQLTPQQALQKLKHYCAYQERCHSEVKDKLYNYGLHTKDVEQIISTLIEENYLDEERFAIHFAGGKFRMKKWGRIKIRYELKKRLVSEFCIKKAIQSIDEDQYESAIEKLVESKIKDAKKYKYSYLKIKYILSALNQKGYEPDLVRPIINKHLGSK
jgi:regulatory protein